MKIYLHYACGGNYKCDFDIPVDARTLKVITDKYGPIDEVIAREVEIEIEDFGLEMTDIPLIQEYGIKEDLDHNFVTIEKIEEC